MRPVGFLAAPETNFSQPDELFFANQKLFFVDLPTSKTAKTAQMKFCGRLLEISEKILSFFGKCYCESAVHFSTFGQIPAA